MATMHTEMMADAMAQSEAREPSETCNCGKFWGNKCSEPMPESDTVTVEYMPDHLRGSHEAAGYTGIASAGQYPHNGAIRIDVTSGHADLITDSGSEWVRIVE